MSTKKSVSYFFDDEIGLYHYSNGHYMKPFRIAMTDELVRGYGLYNKMKIYDSNAFKIVDDDFTIFHAREYIEFLKVITPENKSLYEDQLHQYLVNFDNDCPVFPALYDYCCLYTSGSLLGAQLLNDKKTDIAINWSGGLHHAKKCEASGFCYINDCVLAILELLKVYERVLYIDIDVHHGDGVEEAFFTTDRVMTLSLHKFGDFFPGTGHVDDKGAEGGLNYSVNVPLKDGMDDLSYEQVYKAVMNEIMRKFKPEAIVLQCGSDSLSGDRLGCFNLSIKGHGEAVNYTKSLGVPLLLLGGGGYTLRNVPRCWTYETSIALDTELPNELPATDYTDYFAPEYKLHLPVSNMENQNTREYLDKILGKIMENMKGVSAGGVHITNYKESDGQKVDYDEIYKAKRDQIQEELTDSHITKQTPNLF